MRDITLGDTFYHIFTTRSFSTGIPTTLAGTPVISAYEDSSTTQITAGVSLGVDHDSVTGLNLITVVATSGNGFESGKNYALVITTGTVGGVSVVGETVCNFTIESSAAAGDLANGTDGLGAIKSDTAAILIDTGTTLDGKLDTIDGIVDDILVDTGTTLDGKIDTIDGNVDSILTDTNEIQGKLPSKSYLMGSADADGGFDTEAKADINTEADTALSDYDPPTKTEMDTAFAALNDVSTAEVNAEVDTALSDYDPPTYDELEGFVQLMVRSDAAIGTDRSTLLTAINADEGSGAGDYAQTSESQEALRDRGDAAWTTGSGTGLTALASGTAQGGTSSTIQLAAGETFSDNELNGNVVNIHTGTGAGQSRVITSYTGATDTATVTPNWTTTPDNTSQYEVIAGSTNLSAISNDAQSVTDLKDLIDTGYDPSTHKVQGVVLTDTTTTNTDMRGTDSAALASVCTEGRLSELDAGNIPTDLSNIETDTQDLQTQVGTAGAGLTDLGGMSTSMKAEVQAECTDSLNAYDPPTRAELTTDKNSIITEVDANETKIDTLTTNVAALNDVSSSDVETAVGNQLDAAISSPTAGSLLDLMQRVAALTGHNVVFDDFTFDGDNNQTVGKAYFYDTAAHATSHSQGGGAQTGCIGSIDIAGTYSSSLPTIIKKTKAT